MLKINGTEFPGAGISDLQRGEQKEYKYDLIAEDGTRRFEIRARYRTYDVTFGSITQSDYDALRRAVATGEVISVTLPDGQMDVTLDARVEIGADALTYLDEDVRVWDGLMLNIIGIKPLEDGQ